jgi:hypothetical protein
MVFCRITPDELCIFQLLLPKSRQAGSGGTRQQKPPLYFGLLFANLVWLLMRLVVEWVKLAVTLLTSARYRVSMGMRRVGR